MVLPMPIAFHYAHSGLGFLLNYLDRDGGRTRRLAGDHLPDRLAEVQVDLPAAAAMPRP
jgi:hypothetical protein